MPSDARQVAVISLKNAIKRYWADELQKRAVVIGAEDKQHVKNAMVEMFPYAPHEVRVQFQECLRVIITADFPARWPELVGQIMAWLSSGNQQAITAALRVLRIIARKYEYRDDSDRVELNALVEHVFPQLLATFVSLVESRGSESLELAELLKLCCKIYFSTTYMEVPPLLVHDTRQYEGWMNGFLALAEMRPHEQGMPQDASGRAEWPWWKMKKWLYNIACRMFTKYSVPRVGKKQSDDDMFGQMWNRDYSMKFLHAVVHELSLYSQGRYITPRVANNLLNFLQEAIQKQVYWKELEPHIDQIVQQVVIPMLAFDDADQELWDEDPEEYIRKGYDIIEDIYSPKSAAVTVICELCSKKKKKQLDPTMAHLASILQEVHAAGPAASDAMARKLDGALYAVGSLAGILNKHPRYSAMIPGIFETYILPLFSSPHGYLRAKACWISSEFVDLMHSSDTKSNNQLFMQLFERIQACLNDPDLPVQVDAAVALRAFFDAIDEEDSVHFVQAVPSLLQKFLELANNIESEGIMATIESVVERFSDHIAPYACGIVTTLIQQFWNLVGDEDRATSGEETPFAEVADPLAGHTILATIATVLDAVSKSPEILAEMENILFPIFTRFMSEDGMDVIEEVLEMITYITYYSPHISEKMWTLYPRILMSMETWGTDFFSDFVPVIDNYISRGVQVFLQMRDPPLLTMTNMTLETCLKHESDGFGTEEEIYIGCAAILQVILENCNGLVDQCIRTCRLFLFFFLWVLYIYTLSHHGMFILHAEPYMSLIVTTMLKGAKEDEQFDDPSVMEQLLVAGADALYYNPLLALNTLQQLGQLAFFMHILGDAVTKRKKRSGKLYYFSSKRSKKIVILGLASLVGTQPSSLPPGIQQSIPQIAAALTRLVLDLKSQEASASQPFEPSEERYISDSGDEEDDDDDSYADLMTKLRARSANIEEDDDDEDDFDFFSDDGEGQDIKSPIDDIPVYTYFGNAMNTLQATNAEGFMATLSLLQQDGDIVAQFQQLLSETGVPPPPSS